ncbi:hypothetical protein Patl1_19961 [Pistacia atlantica]|uniref:Uncharacterized protein n=1 Tax=Pistacia atlantica TaxID=434234 RepID=A0ACC1BJT2_9ROSI|nr:hypothetical protein Patl1_19961 [Pistacia atlantica]
MEMQIAGCEKLEYLMSKTSPKVTDPSYAKWYAKNQKVKGWLLTSMSLEIMKRYLRLPIAREIWSALAKAFYDGVDESQLFALNQQAFSTKQNLNKFEVRFSRGILYWILKKLMRMLIVILFAELH